jgi:hypothetical protein
MAIDVIVPWRAGCAYRERAWTWVRQRYQAAGFRVVTAPAARGPWIKATAVNSAVRCSTAELIVVADADCWCEGLTEAVEAVADGAPWAVPHLKVHRLTRAATTALLAGADPEGLETAERPYLAYRGGGIVVARRETLADVPMDPRFIGWGSEDSSWGCALRVLAGRPWMGKAPLWHLYHPPQERLTRVVGSAANEALRDRYLAAARVPKLMRPLIEEIA